MQILEHTVNHGDSVETSLFFRGLPMHQDIPQKIDSNTRLFF